MADVEIRNDRELSRVEARVDGAVAGFAAYRDSPGRRIFTHTEVDPAFEGQGVGGALARAALDRARADGVRVIPDCPFIRGWIDRHPAYAGLVVDE
ncbi:MAG TPA: GNAT family N-acetyltransferase [Candidatus Angelobacter sp.]|nr:GNAT family N-acetyltransferase [Candidatus Angelobacter sp.]